MSAGRSDAWMWARACALVDEAEQRQRQFFELLSTPSVRPVWEPPADVYLQGKEVHISVALPGVSADAVVLEILPTGLLVHAERPLPASEEHSRIMRLEIPYGRFRRRIDLPAGVYRLVSRELVDGCLNVTLEGEWP